MSLFCPKCKAALAQGDRFCGECGAVIGKIQSPPPQNNSTRPAQSDLQKSPQSFRTDKKKSRKRWLARGSLILNLAVFGGIALYLVLGTSENAYDLRARLQALISSSPNPQTFSQVPENKAAGSISRSTQNTSINDWIRYSNPRFGTMVDVPKNGFIANPPPANGDGQSWTSVDGRGQISIYGSFIVTVENFEGYRKYSLNSAQENGITITYSGGRRNWFVYSGIQGNEIIYTKVAVSRKCSSLVANHIYLKYPKSQRKRYELIIPHMAKSLGVLDLNDVCG